MAPKRSVRRSRAQPGMAGASKAPRTSQPTIPSEAALELICPVAVLGICGAGLPPDACDILWKAQAHVSAGEGGRVSIGPILKAHLNPYFAQGSGRRSQYRGAHELVTFKSPRHIQRCALGAKADIKTDMETIPFRDMLPELTFLSAPPLLYHDNIVDILGFFWEPHGSTNTVTMAPTMILEYADQGSLRSFYSMGKTIPSRTRVDLCIDVCRASQTMHHELSALGKSFGLFHGDLKPERRGWFDWLWKLFGYPTKSDYSAKLCDLGSCLRYDGSLPGRSTIGCGTVGWKAPELVNAQKLTMSAPDPCTAIDPLRAEMFSFGLLVSYILLEKDLFRVPAIASFLAAEYFNKVDMIPSLQSPDAIINSHDSDLVLALQASQQWMISLHLDTFSAALDQAIRQLPIPEPTIHAMAHFVSRSLHTNPLERPSSFIDACVMLGGDPKDNRSRTPLTPVFSTFDAADLHTTSHGALVAMNLTTTMPHPVRQWLGDHFGLILHRVQQRNFDEKDRLSGIISLMRGLLRFVPPEVDLSAPEGLPDLRQAVMLGAPHTAAIYSRLCGFIGSRDHLESQIAEKIRNEAGESSVIAREELREMDLGTDEEGAGDSGDTVGTPLAIDDDLDEHATLHDIAYSTDETSAAEFFKRIQHRCDIEEQRPFEPDRGPGGYMNYAPGQDGTALMRCVARNNVDAAKCLVSRGASPFTRNSGGNTPWMFAVASRLVPMVEVFLSCSSYDKRIRQEETKKGIFFSPLNVYIACGRHYIDRSIDLFDTLWKIGALSREDAYLSTIWLGGSSLRLFARLLGWDYASSPSRDLLHAVLRKAVAVADREAVRLILEQIPRLESSNYTAAVFCQAIHSEQPGSADVLRLLLSHLGQDFDINMRFTHRHIGPANPDPMLSADDGSTLLHFAFGRGRVSAGIELIKLGADSTIRSLDAKRQGNGITPLGHLLFPQSNHNYLALRELIRSDFVRRDRPMLVLDNAVLDERRNYNIFHHLCEGEDEQVHNHTGHKTAALRELLAHCMLIVADRPEAAARFRQLLNARTRQAGEERMAPIHVAAANGFTEAIELLARAGVDVLDKVGAGSEPGFAGFTPLHFADMRSSLVWEEEFKLKSRMMRCDGFPWIDMAGPVAAKMKRDYNDRTRKCIQSLTSLMALSSEGREILARRAGMEPELGDTGTANLVGTCPGI